MVIKGDREDQRHYKQQREHPLVISTDNQKEKETDGENHELGSDDVRENRAYEKPVLTFKKSHAVWAVMPDVKRLCDDPGRATRRTT